MATSDRTPVQLRGNLYRIPQELLVFWESNPRTILLKTASLAGNPDVIEGFDRESMQELRESIQDKGLQDPLVVRMDSDGTFSITDGERRSRCIKKLVEDDVLCFDPSDPQYDEDGNPQQTRKAGLAYDYIECRIQDLSEKAAYSLSFQQNSTGRDIGDGAKIALVKKWIQEDQWPEKDIKKITGKSTPWVKETISLCSLDDDTFESLVLGQINRSAALDLLKISDLETRSKVLSKAKAISKNHIAFLEKELANELSDLTDKEEIAEVNLEVAEDEKSKKAAQSNLDKVRKQIADKKSQASSSGRTGSKAVKEAKRSLGQNVKTSLSVAKVKNKWLTPIREALDAGSVSPEQITFYRFADHLCTAFNNGDEDIAEVIERFSVSLVDTD